MHTLYLNITKEQLPIIYRKEYNVKFCGLEKLHPFDTKKYGHIFKILTDSGMISHKTVVVPNEAKNEHLLLVHKKKYLKSLKCSFKVAKIAEIAPLILVPNCLIQKAYLRPMRSDKFSFRVLIYYQPFNLGFRLVVRFWLVNLPWIEVQKVMIVDLDAHQGNGYEADFKGNDNIYIMDVYNKWIYPKDIRARQAIKKNVPIDYNTSDELYLKTIKKNFLEALSEFKPNIIIYNAGTDIPAGDRLGGLSVSEQGIISRDEFIFHQAISRKIPIVMLTSGGYQKKTARIIANSILNLYELGLINNSQEYYF
uniref:Histone deacetylase domain-containing protein n=1 Tax=Dendroctonus ponderosae TaxID=77166 RepID=A0AAR5QDL2_DENPD